MIIDALIIFGCLAGIAYAEWMHDKSHRRYEKQLNKLLTDLHKRMEDLEAQKK